MEQMVKASIKRNLDQANEFEIPLTKKEDVKMSPAEFVSYRHRKLAEKREAKKKKDKSAIASGQCTDAVKK